ncbi:hypothetical protein AK812_SmicGene46918, partial [Symbiodinium microadriaticum]
MKGISVPSLHPWNERRALLKVHGSGGGEPSEIDEFIPIDLQLLLPVLPLLLPLLLVLPWVRSISAIHGRIIRAPSR